MLYEGQGHSLLQKPEFRAPKPMEKPDALVCLCNSRTSGSQWGWGTRTLEFTGPAILQISKFWVQ